MSGRTESALVDGCADGDAGGETAAAGDEREDEEDASDDELPPKDGDAEPVTAVAELPSEQSAYPLLASDTKHKQLSAAAAPSLYSAAGTAAAPAAVVEATARVTVDDLCFSLQVGSCMKTVCGQSIVGQM
jgi:hypothetical protein